MSEASKLGLTEVVLKNDSFYREIYREISVHYVKGSDGSVYAISPTKNVKFCLSGSTFAGLQKSVHSAIDSYHNIDWDKLEGR